MSAREYVASGDDPRQDNRLPDWVPAGVRLYLSHTAEGRSLRELARDHGCHASTVMRQVRRFENRRDDPLVDDALRKLDLALRDDSVPLPEPEAPLMTSSPPSCPEPLIEPAVPEEGLCCLSHLACGAAILIVAPDMPKAVVTRKDADGVAHRVAVFDRAVAEAMALQDWITCQRQGRVLSYVISPTGRAALRNARGDSVLPDKGDDDESSATRRIRYGTTESPVNVLARRRDKNGAPFLSPDQVQAAERLREDFVMAQLDMVDLVTAQEVMTALERNAVPGPERASAGTRAARERVLDVLRELGPGLGDMALRCCCRLEGVESAETALGWSARSGKIVLRIALQRLSAHYRQMGEAYLMIG